MARAPGFYSDSDGGIERPFMNHVRLPGMHDTIDFISRLKPMPCRFGDNA